MISNNEEHHFNTSFIFNIVNCKNNTWRCNGNWFHKINGSEDIIVVCAFCTLLALKAVQFRNVTRGDKLKETFIMNYHNIV